MGCSCQQNKNGTPGVAKSYVVTGRDGRKTTYKSDVEAAAAAKRLGGTYQVQAA